MSTFTIDEVVDALYGGILDREADEGGRARATAMLADDPGLLRQLVSDIVSSPERHNFEPIRAVILRALYRAALGREPDVPGIATYGGLLQYDLAAGALAVADMLHFSPEHQDRLIPSDLKRLVRDHSPNGELYPILRQLTARPAVAPVIVEVGVQDATATVSFDIARMLGWQAVIIENRPRAVTAAKARFAGFDLRVIERPVLELDDVAEPDAGRRPAAIAEMVRHDGHGRATLPGATLSEVLAEAGIAPAFGVLAISAGANTVEVANALVADGVFSPRLMVLATPVRADCGDLGQLGLDAAVAAAYEPVATSPLSLVLARKVEPAARD